MFEVLFFTVFMVLFFIGIYKIYKKYYYQQAEQEIEEWVRGYKRRCTGNNRFVVTPATLQDAFREYDNDVIDKAFNRLVKNNVIQQDPMDNEWCIR